MRGAQRWTGVIALVGLLTLLAGLVVQLRGDTSGTGWVLMIVGISLAGGVTARAAQRPE